MIDKEDMLISVSANEGDKITDQIFKDFPVLDENDIRLETVMFRVFTNTIEYLHACGWSEEDLIKEVFYYCKQSRSYSDDDE